MKIAAHFAKLTRSSRVLVHSLGALLLAGGLLATTPAASAQFGIGVQIGTPRYVAPVGPVYGYGGGYAPGYGGLYGPRVGDWQAREQWRAHEAWLRHERYEAYRFHDDHLRDGGPRYPGYRPY